MTDPRKIDEQAFTEAADILVGAVRGVADDILGGRGSVADAAKTLVCLLDDFLFFAAGGSHDQFVKTVRMMDALNEKLAVESGRPLARKGRKADG